MPRGARIPSLCSPSLTRFGFAQLPCVGTSSEVLGSQVAPCPSSCPGCLRGPAGTMLSTESLIYHGFDNPECSFFFSVLLCTMVSLCFLVADRMRCNLKLPGMTQNGETSSSIPGMEMNLLTFCTLACTGIATRKKKDLFFKACRYCYEVSMCSPRSALIFYLWLLCSY